jgi:DNA recombination protein RmuC
MSMELLLSVAAGVAFGALLVWLAMRSQTAVLHARCAQAEQNLASAQGEISRHQESQAQLRTQVGGLEASLKHERATAEEKLQLVHRATNELREAFQALAADALKSNNQSFLQLAKASLEKFQSDAKGDLEARHKAVEHLVAPIQESLGKVDEKIRQIEKDRSQAYGMLTEQVQSLIGSQKALQTETGNLVKALRTPSVRGRWGEIQLRRVVEIAGMLPYCDFAEQETVNTGDGRLRPDLIVKLPGGKQVVVDAKTPLQAYLEAMEAQDDETRRLRLADHARQVRDHMTRLSSKAYWEQFEASPEFVVMFLPGETFFSAALEQDPGLIEQGVAQRVIPSSPTTLIALLKAVAYGWNQAKLARSAHEISTLGKDLHDRLRSLAGHLEAVGKGLDRAVECYNKAVGTLESRVMVSARKFAELGAPVTEEIPDIEPIETTTRTLSLDWGEDESPVLNLPGTSQRRGGSER